MPNGTFCYLCEQDVLQLSDGKLRQHSPADPRSPNVVPIHRCPGSGLSPSTTRAIAAMKALRKHRPIDPTS